MALYSVDRNMGKLRRGFNHVPKLHSIAEKNRKNAKPKYIALKIQEAKNQEQEQKTTNKINEVDVSRYFIVFLSSLATFLALGHPFGSSILSAGIISAMYFTIRWVLR